MKMLTLVLLFVGCLCAAAAPPNLDELKWKRRVVVIYAPAGSEEQGQRQRRLFAAEKAGFDERDVTEIILQKPEDNPKLARRFQLSGAEFVVLLIGKDGGEKLRSAEVVAPVVLFRLIDSMPMRRDEMRRRN